VENLQRAGQLLRSGNLVAFPTETVYGLGANALDENAIQGIYKSKGRPSDNPLIVHVPDIESAIPFVGEIDEISKRLGNFFWPGPLTLVLPSSRGIAQNVTAGLNTVGIRVPDHPVALALLREAKVPLAAPSANKSGSPSPTTATHVFEDLCGGPEGPAMILDGGACRVGIESTVVEVRGEEIYILRPGGITGEMISEKLTIPMDQIHVASSEGQVTTAPRAPGMKYRHYAPKAIVVGVVDEWPAIFGENTVVIAFDDCILPIVIGRRLSFGANSGDVETASSRLFDLFRQADRFGAEKVYVDCSFDRTAGLGLALWNRVSKAITRN